jgi:hypothetical protein
LKRDPVVTNRSHGNRPGEDWRTMGRVRHSRIPKDLGHHPQQGRARWLSVLLILTGLLIFVQYLLAYSQVGADAPGGMTILAFVVILVALGILVYIFPRMMAIPILLMAAITLFNEGLALAVIIVVLFDLGFFNILVLGVLVLFLLPVVFMLASVVLAKDILFGKGEGKMKIPKMLAKEAM